MPIFAIFGHFLAIFGRFGPFLDREHQKQCNCNLLGATGPTNYINMVSNGYLEIWSVSDPKTNSGAKQDPKLTWGGQNWSFCTLCSPTNLFYTKNVNSEMVTSKSYFLAWNRPSVKKHNAAGTESNVESSLLKLRCFILFRFSPFSVSAGSQWLQTLGGEGGRSCSCSAGQTRGWLCGPELPSTEKGCLVLNGLFLCFDL